MILSPMMKTIHTNNTDGVLAMLQEMVAYATSERRIDLVERKLDDIVNASPQISKFHLGCHISSTMRSNSHIDVYERLAYLRILFWICGNSPARNTSPFASVLRSEAETTIKSPLVCEEDCDFLQSLLLLTSQPPLLEEYEHPEFLVSPSIPLTRQQLTEVTYWQDPKATSPAVPLHFLEPHFVRPSPLITLDSFSYRSSDAKSNSQNEAFHTSVSSDSQTAPKENMELGLAAQDILRSEFIWLNPEYPFQFLRFQLDDDCSQSAHTIEPTYFDSSIIELFETKAYVSPLLPHEEQAIRKAIQELTTNQKSTLSRTQFLKECKLEPQTLPMLVENNHTISIECLLYILSPHGLGGSNDNAFGLEQQNDFLSALVSMDMSLQSMEVVNFLATTPYSRYSPSKMISSEASIKGSSRKDDKPNNQVTPEISAIDETRYLLPKEFLHSFISNCISSCETIQVEKLQKRSVRLCCIFFQNLIQRKIVDVVEVQVEVQAFCIEFSRFREAVVLFKLLKDTEAGNGCNKN